MIPLSVPVEIPLTGFFFYETPVGGGLLGGGLLARVEGGLLGGGLLAVGGGLLARGGDGLLGGGLLATK